MYNSRDLIFLCTVSDQATDCGSAPWSERVETRSTSSATSGDSASSSGYHSRSHHLQLPLATVPCPSLQDEAAYHTLSESSKSSYEGTDSDFGSVTVERKSGELSTMCKYSAKSGELPAMYKYSAKSGELSNTPLNQLH